VLLLTENNIFARSHIFPLVDAKNEKRCSILKSSVQGHSKET